jgi:hypothetical protein
MEWLRSFLDQQITDDATQFTQRRPDWRPPISIAVPVSCPFTPHSPRMHGKWPFHASHNKKCLKLMAASQVNAAAKPLKYIKWASRS